MTRTVTTTDRAYGMATGGNDRRTHLIREAHADHFVTFCGVKTPRRAQPSQKQLPECARCFR